MGEIWMFEISCGKHNIPLYDSVRWNAIVELATISTLKYIMRVVIMHGDSSLDKKNM